ncbi:MAG: hypothetical protein M1434_02630 [Chloroflexi bacterium]|nr:hypothetical protein [Chloroflexota bacterium]MCL5273625.1 hypothetical protein [Chloroflexota bacterium]
MLPGNLLSVTLGRAALQSNGGNTKIFFHVTDPASGKLLAQDDHEPDDGWFPTDYWLKDDVIDDQFKVQLPAGADLDHLALTTGMYDANSERRLTAAPHPDKPNGTSISHFANKLKAL